MAFCSFSTFGSAAADNLSDRHDGVTLVAGGVAFTIGGVVANGDCWGGATLGCGSVLRTCLSAGGGDALEMQQPLLLDTQQSALLW